MITSRLLLSELAGGSSGSGDPSCVDYVYRGRLVGRDFDVAYGNVKGGLQEHPLEQITNEVLVPIAQRIRPFADQYRGFGVGAAALVELDTGILAVLWANNRMIAPGNDIRLTEKLCAEGGVLAKATAIEAASMLAIAISGIPQPDKHSGVITKTLHPCGNCRDEFSISPIVNSDTTIVTVTPWARSTIRETQNLQDILLIHNYRKLVHC